MSERLVTGISRAFWSDPENPARFVPAYIPTLTRVSQRDTCWLDQLFEGGIVLPDASWAVRMVISGPPGTGKSTLALELCARCALEPEHTQDSGEVKRPISSWYVATEVHTKWLIANAQQFKWPHTADLIGEDEGKRVRVVDLDYLKQTQEPGPHPSSNAEQTLAELICELFGHRKRATAVDKQPALQPTEKRPGPGIVVIDSLNTIRGNEFDNYEHFMNLAAHVHNGPRLIVALADSGPQGIARTWEYAADIVLRLDTEYVSGYLLRTIEVVKARFQAHVWGRHQLKIYEAFSSQQSNRGAAHQARLNPTNTGGSLEDAARREETRLRRAHPYRKEGGIFIFPSIHYVLSRYKNESPSVHHGKVESPVANLNAFLGTGFPRGRCTALIGDRGTHKSHLGYLQVLSGAVEQYREDPGSAGSERAIVVSLRDDEGMTRETMAQNLNESWASLLRERRITPQSLLETLERQGRLEITHFPPGFITPEEFFHRLLLSIHRIKQGNRSNVHVSLLFNSLDQLSSRFPLCAAQRIFIPGIIQMLSAEGVTSYFVAADDVRRSDNGSDRHPQTGFDYYGLDAMAELILQLRRGPEARKRYFELLRQARPQDLPPLDNGLELELPETVSRVELSVERFAGGQPAGAAGILELVGDGTAVLHKIVGRNGLILVPYASEGARQLS
jgi:KaiC/GvpD/RAD55 family RecA-like ATPase